MVCGPFSFGPTLPETIEANLHSGAMESSYA
jgi:hypothetical protein